MHEKQRRLEDAVMEVAETLVFLRQWGRVPGARDTEWYRGNEATLRVQREELAAAVAAWLS